jgi:Ca2+-transporting ATPase|tara:strand:- start:6764 stop:9973 length:3210 start_codon:yes stop_codon:yes gene_type:complete
MARDGTRRASSSSASTSTIEMTAPVYPAWSNAPARTLAHHDSDETVGIASASVDDRRARAGGHNELEREPGKALWRLVLEQFDDALVKVLLAAAAVSLALAYAEGGAEEGLAAYAEPAVIALILVLNAIVGVWQESNAERALDALKEMQSEHAKCLRDGRWNGSLEARELVPGDVVELKTGDRVPADCRVIRLKTATVRVEQASLTGESVAVDKRVESVKDEDIELQGKTCMLFAGTAVSNGCCLCVVNSTGMSTEIGKIQSQIKEASEEEEDTPLKQKLDRFGESLTMMIGVICLLVWLINYRHFVQFEFKAGSTIPSVAFDLGKCTYYFKIAIALAVAAIPEGLPAVITTCLALGTRKMAKKNAIVRKLPSVETLGCTSVICSDKTGTLTTNQMSAVKLITVRDETHLTTYTVEGTTYNPTEGGVVGAPKKLDASLRAIAKISALCNGAQLEYKNDTYKCVGEPTEGALKVLCEKIGLDDMRGVAKKRSSKPEQHAQIVCDMIESAHDVRATLEFDRDRKSMSVIASEKTDSKRGSANELLVKGAPEVLLERCAFVQMPDGATAPLSATMRNVILNEQATMARDALRCLAFAKKVSLGDLSSYDGSEKHKAHKVLKDPSAYASIESDLIFVGMTGLRDPPRPEVAGAIKACHTAGIRVIVITGDNKLTAEAICTEIGVFKSSADVKGKSFTGREFAAMSKSKQLKALLGEGGRVFSRTEPKHKQDIVRLLRDSGDVVAMTGDGVNDAPALKLADIGIAMGIAGTEVAKEASDMVLADDNFSTIVEAVSEGRSIYNNMKAFIRYMISSNVGEVVSIFLTAALGMPEGLVPVQLLWVNLVTDGPPATALGFNPPDKDIMTKPPRRKDEDLLSNWVMFRYAVVGLYVGVATVGAFAIWFTRTSFMGIDLSQDGHTPVTFKQLTNWGECASWKNFKGGKFTAGGVAYSYTGKNACDYFEAGKVKASTLSLTVLVAIEMFNALNALSEDGSLVTMPPWRNPYLLIAMLVSFGSHFLIMYVPYFAEIFSIVPLDFNEWMLVLLCAAPVCLIDEVLKVFGRVSARRELKARLGY